MNAEFFSSSDLALSGGCRGTLRVPWEFAAQTPGTQAPHDEAVEVEIKL